MPLDNSIAPIRHNHRTGARSVTPLDMSLLTRDDRDLTTSK